MLTFSPRLPSRKYITIIISCSILLFCGCFLICSQILFWAACSWILIGITGGCWPPSHQGDIQHLANESLSAALIYLFFPPHSFFLPTEQPSVTPLGCFFFSVVEQHTTGLSGVPVKLSLLLSDYCGDTKLKKE